MRFFCGGEEPRFSQIARFLLLSRVYGFAPPKGGVFLFYALERSWSADFIIISIILEINGKMGQNTIRMENYYRSQLDSLNI
jgi:hypothetical protein